MPRLHLPSRFGASLVSMALGLITCTSIAAEQRDWKLHPAIIELEMPSNLYALGDVHGDYEKLVGLIAGCQLIKEVPKSPGSAVWSGGAAVLVCTGDFIDKSDHSMEVIALLRALQPQAEKAGGRLIVTLGNHEAAFLASGGAKKKSAEFAKELVAAGLAPADVTAGQDALGIGAWIRDLPCAAKVDDWFFCHAGNSGGRSVEQLRTDLQAAITADGFGAKILSDANSMLEARLHPRQWWDAAADVILQPAASSQPTPAEAGAASEARLRKVVEALGCKHLVIGHQPGQVTFADGSVRESGRIVAKFDGLLFLIDTGMSRGQHSDPAAMLRLRRMNHHITAAALDSQGKPEIVWNH